MRTLCINKIKLWYVNPLSRVPLLDSDGFDTGESIMTYSTPIAIFIGFQPSNGSIVEQIFGKDASLDMVSISNDIVLQEGTLLFKEEPTGNYETTYDYRVSNIKESLNTFNYGFRRRT